MLKWILKVKAISLNNSEFLSGGARARSKGTGSSPSGFSGRPVGVGLRGFESHPPHQTGEDRYAVN